MPRLDFPGNILEFQRRFADEALCLEYLAASRWPDGYRCPACGGDRAWVLARRHLWQCVACGHQASVRAGTVLHGTRTPLPLWFWAAYLVSTLTPGSSALQLQRQLGISRYERAWTMLHKLRRAMVARERESLKGEVEADEFFLGGYEQGLRGGRQRGGKALVAAAVEVRGAGSGRLRLSVVPDASAASLGGFVAAAVAPGTIVHTDGWAGYADRAGRGYEHRPRSQRANPDEQTAAAPPSGDLQPQELAARNPSRRLRRPPAGLPRRVRLPLQPARHTDGRLPDPARPRQPARTNDLPPDPRPT